MRSKINTARIYRDLFDAYVQDGKDPNEILISESDLVLDAALTTGMSVASFNVNVTSGNPQAWEVRLAQTDAFRVCRWGVYAYGIIGTTTGPAGSTSYEYWTYAPWELKNSFVTINPIWDSGLLNMNLNSKQYVKNLATNRSKMKPRTGIAPFQALTTSGSANSAFQNSMELGQDGMVDMEPGVFLQGNWNNNVTIGFSNPAGIAPVTNYAFVADDGSDVYISISRIILRFEGLVCQNLTAILGV